MAVLEAADDLLAERGFAGVTIEGIAVRAQVSKQTIYRWWTSKTDILFDALADDAAAYFTMPDGDDLGADLRYHLRQVAVFLAGTDAGGVCRALAGQAQHDGEVAARFRAEFVAPQRDRDRAPFRRARERGELADDTDLDVAVDQLVGPVYYRVLITGQPAPPEFTDALVEQYLKSKDLFTLKCAIVRPETAAGPSPGPPRRPGASPTFRPWDLVARSATGKSAVPAVGRPRSAPTLPRRFRSAAGGLLDVGDEVADPVWLRLRLRLLSLIACHEGSASLASFPRIKRSLSMITNAQSP
ncbi:MAG TPA: TetR/AcrR family transcriptional regulator [Trebonia sp.]